MSEQTDKYLLEEDEKKGKWLFIGLLAILFLEYFNPNAFIPALNPAKIKTIIPFSVALLFLVSGVRQKISDSQNKLILVIMILSIMSIFLALVKLYAIDKTKVVIGYTLLYFILIHSTRSIKRMNKIIWLIIIIHIMLAYLNPVAIAQAAYRMGHFKGSLFLGDGNDFSLSLVVFLPFCVYLLLIEKKKLKKLILLFCAIIFISLLILLQSRGSTLGLAAIIIFLWLQSKKK